MILILVLMASLVGNGDNLFAGSLYDSGYEKGFFDAVNRISYFVSPCEGQDEEWVNGYKTGHKTGLKATQPAAKDLIQKFEGRNLINTMIRVKDLYHAVSMGDDESTYEYYMTTSRKLSEMVITDFQKMNQLGESENEDTCLNQYINFLGSLDIEQRDAYIPVNKTIMDYLVNGYKNAMENGTRYETRMFGEAIRKVEYLVGRGTVI